MEVFYEAEPDIKNSDTSDEKKKRKPRSDIGKPRQKRVIKEEKYKIMIVLNNIPYSFKNVEDVKRHFEDEKNIKEDEDLKKVNFTEEMKYILTTPFLLRRLCYVNNGSDGYLKKNNTRQKYLSIPNLKIVPLV